MNPVSLLALVGNISGMIIITLIWFELRSLYRRVSIKKIRVDLLIGAHLLFLHASTIPYIVQVPRLWVGISETYAVILLPTFTLLLLLRFREMFTMGETEVEDIPWGIVGTRTGLLKLYSIWINSILRLTGPVLSRAVVESIVAQLKTRYQVLDALYFDTDGRVEIQTEQITSPAIDETILSFSVLINRIYIEYRAILGQPAEDQVRGLFSSLLRERPPILADKPQILSYLFGGALNGRSSTGTSLDEVLDGGVTKGESVIIVAPRGRISSILTESYLVQGILGGDHCHYVSSLRTPEEIRSEFSDLPGVDPGKIHVIDCHSFLTREVSKVIQKPEDNMTLCPNFGVVDFVLSQALESGEKGRGRVVIDILPTWVSLIRQEGLYPIILSISKMVEEIRERESTCVILLDPHLLEPQEEYLLAELINKMIGLRTEVEYIGVRMVKGKNRATDQRMLFDEWMQGSVSDQIRQYCRYEVPEVTEYPNIPVKK